VKDLSLKSLNNRKILGLPFFGACTAISWGASAGFFITIYLMLFNTATLAVPLNSNVQHIVAAEFVFRVLLIGLFSTFFVGLAFALAFIMTNPWSLISKHIDSSIVLAGVVLIVTVFVGFTASVTFLGSVSTQNFEGFDPQQEKLLVYAVVFNESENGEEVVSLYVISLVDEVEVETVLVKDAKDFVVGSVALVDSTITQQIAEYKVDVSPLKLPSGEYTLTLVSTKDAAFTTQTFTIP
jgi:hypothetical protein